MPILMDSDERPIEVDDGAATEIFRLRAENERLREHHKVAVDWWMQEAQSVKPLAEEVERLNAKCDDLAHQLNRCNERSEQMRRLLVWAEALIRSLSGWPEHHPSEVVDWKENWRKVREGE